MGNFYTQRYAYVSAVYAAVSSLSLSLLATGIDSVFDIGSNVLLLWLNKKANQLDANKWPVGGTRLETIGNIVYGAARSHSLAYLRTSLTFPVAGFLYVVLAYRVDKY